MYRNTLTLALCAAVLMVGSYAMGGDKCNGLFKTTCPKCHNCCVLKAECVQEEKSCWEVECKEICIPCVVFPWQKWKMAKKGHCGKNNCGCCAGTCDSVAGGCDGGCGSCCSTVNNGARVKTVKVLKKKKYECPTCKYQWEPACCGNGCGNGCGDGCCDDGCRNGGCDYASLSDGEAEAPTEAYNIPLPRLDTTPLRQIKSNTRLEKNNVARRSLSDG